MRAATLDHGSISAFRTGFAEGITPLFPSGSGIQGYDQALIKATATVNNSADLQIKVLNPTSAVLAKGGWVETVLRENGQSVQEIPNSRLIYASTGTTHAGETLQAANLLKIRTTYCYPLWVPYISEVIGQLMAHSGSSWDQQCYQNNGIPIAAVSTQLMQSSLYPQDVTDLAAPASGPTVPTAPPATTPPPTGNGATTPTGGNASTTPASGGSSTPSSFRHFCYSPNSSMVTPP